MPNDPTSLWRRLTAAVAGFFHSDVWRRTWRTWAQAFLAVMALRFTVDELPTITTGIDVLVSAGWAGVVAVITLAHNELEDHAPRLDTRKPPEQPHG